MSENTSTDGGVERCAVCGEPLLDESGDVPGACSTCEGAF